MGSAPKRGDQHENKGGERGERAGSQRRDAGLIAQRREVINPSQAHHLPPGVLVMPAFPFVGALHLAGMPAEQPARDGTGRTAPNLSLSDEAGLGLPSSE